MANPTSQALDGGNKLIAGAVTTEQVDLAADTYYRGMPLACAITTTAAATDGTGNGTATLLSADPGVPAGAYVLTATAALVFDLASPGGDIIATGLTVENGGATAFDVAGLKFTLTDGATAWVATDSITITVSANSVYSYSATQMDAFYNGETKTLSSAGYGSVITSGEICEGGIVDDSGDALTITDTLRAEMRSKGFSPRQVA